ncbi:MULTISPECIES: hypothetical protein [Kocuria]|uniref:Uncharacterized protein n=1 Tax=Kocuria rhizophila TaxID=72000 RepID=A0AAX2SDQ4_KOCRH|nr:MULTISPECIES: hypothetical protein [Kocuria]OFK06108.1 hypothetical protein HMPREF2833_06820 [Kocuria sp. HMSC066H03]TFH99303.1 hypothetical protein E4P33_10675 [Kocuria rhizophila]TFI04822.1 hypothetical protein E4P34_10620 [Kocuria rhizophila]
MDDLIAPRVVDLAAQLAATLTRNTAAMIQDKVTSARASRDAEGRAQALEQIVNDLIEDKNELTRIAQAYQQELVAQRLTPGDVQYIATTVVPLLTTLAGASDDEEEAEKSKQQIETFAPLLSVETVNVLQLIGFNFRQGIGAPLTRRVRDLIEGTSNSNVSELALEQLRSQRAAMELSMDADSYARFREMYPPS